MNGLDVLTLVDALRKTGDMSSSTYKKLALEEFKINQGLSIPAYVVKNPVNNESKFTADNLGFGELTMPQKREKAYKKWSVAPNMCTADEIDMAMTYRHDNDLMSEDESAEYWSKLMSQSK